MTAVILYKGDAGPAYVFAWDVLLNGKPEVYLCSGNEPIEGGDYRRLPKARLALGMTLERAVDGMLYLTQTSGTSCAVPANLKLDKGGKYSPRELADKAVIQGKFLSRSSNGTDAVPSELKPGTKIQFVAEPDTELAEYLRAFGAQDIALWRTYLSVYPKSPHAGEARQSLATLIVAAAESDLSRYDKSVEGKAPDYSRLQQAKVQTEEARQLAPAMTRAEKLQFEVRSRIQGIVMAGRTELMAFQNSLVERISGYEHLSRAQAHIRNALVADPAFEPALKLQTDINALAQAMEQALATAESLAAAQRFDEAVTAVSRYRQYSAELPRVAAVLEMAFRNRREHGDQHLQAGRWEEAATEFRRALAYKEDPDTAAALKKAETELHVLRTREAVETARGASKSLAEGNRFVEAYEKLAELPEEQRALLADDLEALRPKYLRDLVQRSDALARLHVPIRGRADEDAVRQAHEYLRRAAHLADDESIKVKLDLLGDRISQYYLKESKRLLDKPRGSGIGLGWLMLQEAQRYKPDLEAAKDQLTKYFPLYETRAKLSLSVHFRDQTSRRDSVGLADQLVDTIASGLESAGLTGVKIVSSSLLPAAESDPNIAVSRQPNFQLLGDILQHRVDKKVDTQRLSSRFRAGQREVRNPEWLEVKHQLDAVEEEINRLPDLMRPVPGRKKLNTTEVARQRDELGARQTELRKKLELLPEYILQDTILPYNYTKRTVQLAGIVELSFRLADAAGVAGEMTRVKQELPKTYVLLENVKPEDVEGIQEEGYPPDEMQLLAEAETQVQRALLEKLLQKLKEMPARILQEARGRVERKELEGAAESYILYLNVTPNKATPERQEAVRFLQKEFNMSSLAAGPS